jgi:hypothetical protein
MLAVELDQAVLQRLARQNLQVRIERGAHRQAALVERILAVTADDLLAHFLGEVLRREDIVTGAAEIDAERLRLGDGGLVRRDVAVLDHAVDDPVAARDRGFRVVEGLVVVGRLGQRGEVGRFLQVQFVDRLAEVGQRRTGDAVGTGAEEDLVEVEFEDAVLGIGLLDTERQNRFADLAVDGPVVGQQEVLGDLLGDRRCADQTAPGLVVLNIGDDGAGQREKVDATVIIEILVLGRQEGRLDAIRERPGSG